MATEPYVIQQLLVTESGRIGPDIYKRSLFMSPWLALTKQEEFPEEMGDTISVLTYERSIPNYPLTWNTIGQSQDPTSQGGTGTTGGACLPPVAQVNFAETLRTYNLQHMALESPPICVNDLRVSFKRKEQLNNMMKVLTDNTSFAWINRYRDEFTRIAGHKVIASAGGGFPESTSAFPLTVPDTTLTQGILRKYYQKLVRNGAGANPMARENGRPVFCMITDSETSENLILGNQAVRQDFRWSDRVKELLAPLGVERSYGGFFHLIDDLPARWDFVGGVWVRRYPYVGSAATKGTRFDIDPVYENAAYTDTIIFVDDVMVSMVPRPITAPGGNTQFDPVTYRGEFKWKNIPHATDNPDGTIGFFRGIFAQGTKPVFPDYGFVIRHIRCDAPLGATACAGLATS